MQLVQITPFIPCTSLDRQIEFYGTILSFKTRFRADNYAFLHRDQVAVRLIEVDETVNLHHPERQNSIYIDVKDIDALYASMQERLETLPIQRVRAPFNQDYGQREFHVIDEDCTLIFFGEPVAQ